MLILRPATFCCCSCKFLRAAVSEVGITIRVAWYGSLLCPAATTRSPPPNFNVERAVLSVFVRHRFKGCYSRVVLIWVNVPSSHSSSATTNFHLEQSGFTVLSQALFQGLPHMLRPLVVRQDHVVSHWQRCVPRHFGVERRPPQVRAAPYDTYAPIGFALFLRNTHNIRIT